MYTHVYRICTTIRQHYSYSCRIIALSKDSKKKKETFHGSAAHR